MSQTHTALDYRHVNWQAVPAEQVAPGVERRMVYGDHLMVCRLVIGANVVTAQHRHHHEQMTLVVRGRARFFIDGAERIAVPGDVLLFPSNILHGATMMDEEVELIDIFHPLREDFLASAEPSR